MTPSFIIFSLAALLLAVILTWRIPPRRFQELKGYLVIASFLFWAMFGVFLIQLFWSDYYRLILPEWFISANLVEKPLLLGLLLGVEYGLLGLLLWWLADRTARFIQLRLGSHPASAGSRLPWLASPVLWFCLWGGLEAVPEHLLGLYAFKILEKSPILQGMHPLSLLVFAIPEYMVYWGIVMGLGAILGRVKRWPG